MGRGTGEVRDEEKQEQGVVGGEQEQERKKVGVMRRVGWWMRQKRAKKTYSKRDALRERESVYEMEFRGI